MHAVHIDYGDSDAVHVDSPSDPYDPSDPYQIKFEKINIQENATIDRCTKCQQIKWGTFHQNDKSFEFMCFECAETCL